MRTSGDAIELRDRRDGLEVQLMLDCGMAMDQAKNAAHRLLESIEEGTMNVPDLRALVEDADPALIYLIFTWVRKRYADHVNADAVLGRLLEISNQGSVRTKMKEGQADAVVQWFEETYSYRDLGSKEFIELIIEKLEG